MESYWGQVHREAFQATRLALGFDSWGGVVIRVILGIAVVSALMLWGSDDAAHDELVFRGAAALLVVGLFPLLYLTKVLQFLPAPLQRSQMLLDRLEHEVEALRAQKASLSIMPQNWDVAVDNKDGAWGVAFVVLLVVTNQGASPSAAFDWRLQVRLPTKLAIAPAQYHESLWWDAGNDEQFNLTRKDSIVEKTWIPVGPGSIVSGYFVTLFPPEIAAEFQDDTVMTLCCKQVDGKEVMADFIYGNNYRPFSVLPGMDGSFSQVEPPSSNSDQTLD